MRYLIAFLAALGLFACSGGDKDLVPVTGSDSVDDQGYNAASAKTAFEAGKYCILTLGLPHYDPYQDSFAKAIGLCYENLGCDVSDGLQKGVDAYNAEMYRLLEQKNGRGWKDKYDHAMDSVMELIRERARSVMDSIKGKPHKKQ